MFIFRLCRIAARIWICKEAIGISLNNIIISQYSSSTHGFISLVLHFFPYTPRWADCACRSCSVLPLLSGTDCACRSYSILPFFYYPSFQSLIINFQLYYYSTTASVNQNYTFYRMIKRGSRTGRRIQVARIYKNLKATRGILTILYSHRTPLRPRHCPMNTGSLSRSTSNPRVPRRSPPGNLLRR